jgi:hypothetical protein
MIVTLRETLLFSVRFLTVEISSILRRTLIPAVLGALVFYFLLDGYCIELLDYLLHPNDVMASRVLGIAAAGGLILLLLNAVIVAALARLVLREKQPERSFMGIGVAAWRIYTANLRLLLAIGSGGLLLWLVLFALRHISLFPGPDAVRIFCFLAIYWVGVRGWFFVAPLSVLGSPAGTLTDTWHRSSGHVFPIAITLFVLLLAGVVFQAAGEFTLRSFGALSLSGAASFQDSVELYRRNLLPISLLISVSYLVVTILLTAARVDLYRRLSGASAVP